MKRLEFVNRWCAIVREGRKRNFPDITPAEMAASAWSDQKTALRLWRKHRLHTRTHEELERVLSKDAATVRGEN